MNPWNEWRIRPMQRTLYISLILSFAVPAWTAAEPIQITTTRVQLNPADVHQTTLEKLLYKGGLHIKGDHKRFGGLSGLVISDHGTRLTAVSDRGYWFIARLFYDGRGWLGTVTSGELSPILNTLGAPVSGLETDAEELSLTPDGKFLVSFEHAHRIAAYPAKPLAARPQRIATPSALSKAPPNGGIEAMTVLKNGKLLVITEKQKIKTDHYTGWIIDSAKAQWKPIVFQAHPNFHPVALVTLPSGDVVALERNFRPAGRLFWVRISHIPRQSIAPNQTIKGEQLGLLDSRLTSDNFEGLATRRDASGNDLIYLISDDNYASYQRTLLLQFQLGAPKK